MEYHIETSGEMHILKLSGELTIQFAAKLRELLLEMIRGAKNIHIQIDHAAEVDISCFQLLCSAHKTASESERHLTLDGRSSDIFNQRLQEAGLGRTKGCAASKETSCLWIGGAPS